MKRWKWENRGRQSPTFHMHIMEGFRTLECRCRAPGSPDLRSSSLSGLKHLSLSSWLLSGFCSFSWTRSAAWASSFVQTLSWYFGKAWRKARSCSSACWCSRGRPWPFASERSRWWPAEVFWWDNTEKLSWPCLTDDYVDMKRIIGTLKPVKTSCHQLWIRLLFQLFTIYSRLSVWPDVGIKSNPTFSKHCPKSSLNRFS